MNNALLRNPAVLDGSNITTAGREIYGIRKGDGGKFTDFGVIESIEPNRDETKRTLKGSRKGRTKTYKEVIDESTFSVTFQTSATGDAAVREWFLGTSAIETVLAGGDAEGDNTIRAFSNDANLGEGAFIVVASTEESDGKRSIIRVFPNGSIQGNGEPSIQDFDGYQFLMTATSNRGWEPPATLGDFGADRPDGVIYDVPNARVEEVLNTLAAALATYVGA